MDPEERQALQVEQENREKLMKVCRWCHILVCLFLTVLTGVLSRVTLPMLSRMQNDDERLAKVYRQMLRLSAFVVFPLMLGLALLARPLIVLMIT